MLLSLLQRHLRPPLKPFDLSQGVLTCFPSSVTVCLQDSVLAFWRHGMQGRSFRSNEVLTIQSKKGNTPASRLCHNICFFLLSTGNSRDQWHQPDVPSAGLRQVRHLSVYLFVHLSVHTSVISPVCLSVCRVVVLESRATDNPTEHSNLYILAGHENSYWE